MFMLSRDNLLVLLVGCAPMAMNHLILFVGVAYAVSFIFYYFFKSSQAQKELDKLTIINIKIVFNTRMQILLSQ